MNVLHILPSLNVYGGTPKKTLDLVKNKEIKSCLYSYSTDYSEFKSEFEIYCEEVKLDELTLPFYQKIKNILTIIDEHQIEIVQTQFSYGEVLGGIIKLLRPSTKLIVAFVGPFSDSGIKKFVLKLVYTKVDHFVYVSNYVKKEKQRVYQSLKNKPFSIVYNGTELRNRDNKAVLDRNCFALLSIAGLVDWKNHRILVEAMNILVNEDKLIDIKLYIVGEGPERENLENMTARYLLSNNVFLLGYRKDIGDLLESTNVFVHSSQAEGFGIAVAEAMLHRKPVIASDAGAMPELIHNLESGLIVPVDDQLAWADAIRMLHSNPVMADSLANAAYERANNHFTIYKFQESYSSLYKSLLI